MDMYSVACIRDLRVSRPWYEAFFGRPADEIVGEEYLWQVGQNAWVVLDDRPVRAARVGGTMITFGVTNLEEILGRLATVLRCSVGIPAARRRRLVVGHAGLLLRELTDRGGVTLSRAGAVMGDNAAGGAGRHEGAGDKDRCPP